MKIVIAPDSFKESLSAVAVAETIKSGFESSFPEADYVLLPVGDGGEGTLEAIAKSMMLTERTVEVTGPFGRKVLAKYAADSDVGIIEMAEIVGLSKIPIERRDPLLISTKGIGELIKHLVERGVTTIIVAVGGSASNDGGIGMASALGYHFYDEKNQKIEPIGANLDKVTRVCDELSLDLSGIKVIILSDVNNPLCGENGATHVFGRQKGLPEESLEAVDQSMATFYEKVNSDIIETNGSGAGGGMGAGLMTFAQGTLVSGIDYVLDIIDFDQAVKNADLVIVGEGRIDSQSLSGKAPIGIAQRTPDNIPVLAICGSVAATLEEVQAHNIKAMFSTINQLGAFQEIKANAKSNLFETSQNVASLYDIK